jgi:capsular exopolysaccharide synthesis family protein
MDLAEPMQGPGGDDGDATAGVLDFFRKIRKHWMVVLGVALAVSVGVTFFTLGQKKIYASASTVYFDPNPPRPLGKGVEMVVDNGPGNYWSNKEFTETQQKLMKSMRVAMAVVRDHGLEHDPAFLANAPPGAKVAPREVLVDEAARILLLRVKVEPSKNTYLATLSYEDANPERAQRITQALVETYMVLNMEDVQSSTGAAVEWLNGQLDKLKTGLESSEMALHEYKLDKNMLSVDYDSQSNMLREQIKQLSDALTTVRIRREELAARNSELQKVTAQDPSVLPATELLQNSLLQQLKNSYSDALRERNAMTASGKGANHPEMLAAQARVDAAKTALLAEVRNVQGAVARDLAIIRRQEGGLSGLFEQAKKQALDLNLLEIQYKRLWRSKENNEKLYSLVLERAKEADLTRMLRVSNVRVIDKPLVPSKPARPNVPLNLMLGVFGGLILGVGAAFMRDLMDRTIKTPAHVEGYMGVALLGVLPLVSDISQKMGYYARRRHRNGADGEQAVKPELIVHAFPKSGVAEAARAIRTNLQFMTPDKPARTVLVTSAGPAEGKTTVAFSIAVALAQAGLKVVLIDCDLRRPRVHRVLGKSSDTGISTALLDDKPFEPELLRTEVPNLSAIPAGPVPPNPSELLQSERFKALLQRLQGQFDRVVIDSPPVLPITDAAILATQVDGVVLVVRASKTTKEMGRAARQLLEGVGGRIFGCVLNAVDLSRVEYKYYYYQYYKQSAYTYGYGEPTAPSQESAADTAN